MAWGMSYEVNIHILFDLFVAVAILVAIFFFVSSSSFHGLLRSSFYSLDDIDYIEAFPCLIKAHVFGLALRYDSTILRMYFPNKAFFFFFFSFLFYPLLTIVVSFYIMWFSSWSSQYTIYCFEKKKCVHRDNSGSILCKSLYF